MFHNKMGLRSLIVLFIGGDVWRAISVFGGMCNMIGK